MNLREPVTILIGAIFVLSIGYSVFMKLKPGIIKNDNPVEEFVEGIIHDATGVKIDTTPSEETGGFIQEFDVQNFGEFMGDLED